MYYQISYTYLKVTLYSALGWNYSGGVILSWNGTTLVESFSAGETTPGESFCPEMNDPRGVILLFDGTTPESFSPGMERLQESPSVL